MSFNAGAEAVQSAEGNMSGAAMRGTVALPGSETSSRTKGSRRNLGDLLSPAAAQAASGRGGKLVRAKPPWKAGGVGRPRGQGGRSPRLKNRMPSGSHTSAEEEAAC
jgi:hypothetical protein